MELATSRAGLWILRIFFVLLVVFLYVPLLVLVVFSFNKGDITFPLEGFTVSWYQLAAKNPTLLAALQREARFVDLVQEPLENYEDAQIGAAARDVLRDCRGVLQRLFAIEPLLSQEEGSAVEVRPGYDAGQFRLTGSIAGEPPFQGRLMHHGWRAAQCQLPVWTGSRESARVIAAAEVEVPAR